MDCLQYEINEGMYYIKHFHLAFQKKKNYYCYAHCHTLHEVSIFIYLSGHRLQERNKGDEAHDKAGVCCFSQKVP